MAIILSILKYPRFYIHSVSKTRFRILANAILKL